MPHLTQINENNGFKKFWTIQLLVININQTYTMLAKLRSTKILCVMLRNIILWIKWYSELTNFELSRFSCTPELLH